MNIDPFECFGNDDSDDDDSNDDNNDCVNDNNKIKDIDDDDQNDTKRKRLIEDTNSRISSRSFIKNLKNENGKDNNNGTCSSNSNDDNNNDKEEEVDYNTNKQELLLWPSYPPLYVGPMTVHTTRANDSTTSTNPNTNTITSTSSSDNIIGGGRGWHATRDMKAGTLLLVEEPMVKGWPKEQLGMELGLISIESLLLLFGENDEDD